MFANKTILSQIVIASTAHPIESAKLKKNIMRSRARKYRISIPLIYEQCDIKYAFRTPLPLFCFSTLVVTSFVWKVRVKFWPLISPIRYALTRVGLFRKVYCSLRYCFTFIVEKVLMWIIFHLDPFFYYRYRLCYGQTFHSTLREIKFRRLFFVLICITITIAREKEFCCE
jgi:hypothetical protein